MSDIIRIGTRKSKLAMWQASFVADKLEGAGLNTEIVPIDTRGDQVLDVSIAKIGSKGVFTEELEILLEQGHIDIAVHSAKDMQSELPKGFEIIAFTEREIVNDVLLSNNNELRLTDENLNWIIGTSSTRRKAILKHYFPHVKTVDVRGNLQTRIAKMESGLCDALLLAYAGVHRMGYDNLIVEKLDINTFTPPTGQGSIAVESSVLMPSKKRKVIRECVNHPATEWLLLAERSYLKKLKGGCSIPAFALAQWIDAHDIVLIAGLYSLDGQKKIAKKIRFSHQQAEKAGLTLGEQVLQEDGDLMLKEIREQLDTK
ncbi:MAG: hydroxymethylbilane synthase [Cyclobacteriaceae bacterium]|nr:hydroxymethylbilane synthase [Cyclobacteriaceae bacterium]